MDPHDPVTERTSVPQELGPGRPAEHLAASFALIVLGLLLAATPFIVGHTPGDAAWLDVTAGTVVALFAAVALVGGARAAWLQYVVAGVGVWVAASAIPLHERPLLTYTVALLGVVIFLLAALGTSASTPASPARSVRGRDESA